MESILIILMVVWAIVGPVGYIAGLWCIGRHIFSEHPEVKGLIGLTVVKGIMMIPPWGSITGPVVGISYLLGYQRRKRAEPVIQQWIRNIDPKYIARSLDEQIKTSSVQKGIVASVNLREDQWLKENWIELSPTQRIANIRDNLDALRPNIRKYLHAWRFRTNFGRSAPDFYVEADWATAWRDTIDPSAVSLSEDIYNDL